MKVNEVIHFNHELDLLETHIVEASYYADRVIIKEGECDWNGEPKPLHAIENWKRFGKYPKAEILVIPAKEFVKPSDRAGQRLNESRTRTYGWEKVTKGADWIIECDVDEIVDHRRFHLLQNLMAEPISHIQISYQNFIWFMNNRTRHHRRYRAFKTGDKVMPLDPKNRRRTRSPSVGWHFSGCFDNSGWDKKYRDMPFLYGLTKEEAETLDWQHMRREGLYVDRNRNLVPIAGTRLPEVDLNDYPQFVRENPERFPWFGEVSYK